VGECLAVQANATYFPRGTAISCVRYGNVLDSRGSALEIWRRQLADGMPLTLTDPAMTRFIITADEAVQFVLDAAYDMEGGEVFVPILPAATIGDLATALALEAGVEDPPFLITGPRPGGEKYHESLLNGEERRHRLRLHAAKYAVIPTHREWSRTPYTGEPIVLDEPYTSETAPRLTVGVIRSLLP
jgi:FlaA1/EpsC-like NDP-sugar epimerase